MTLIKASVQFSMPLNINLKTFLAALDEALYFLRQ